jgi:hypothetical protein
MSGKTYKIETIAEMLDVVNKENFEDIMKDFLGFVDYTIQMLDNFRNNNPNYKNFKNSEILEKIIFEWTDDGINKLTEVRLTNPKTGEVTSKKL